jgi:hypothetical protein
MKPLKKKTRIRRVPKLRMRVSNLLNRKTKKRHMLIFLTEINNLPNKTLKKWKISKLRKKKCILVKSLKAQPRKK